MDTEHRNSGTNQNIPYKVAFITGASSGIGKACAKEFYRHGYAVVLFARRKHLLEELSNELGGDKTLVISGSVTDRVRIFEAIREAVQKFGRIDVLINNAGAGLNSFFETMDPTDFHKVMDLNIMGVVHATQAVIPFMKDQQCGHIVNISSMIGKLGVPSRSAYCTSKFALEGLSESIRTELSPYGIQVLVVRPSGTQTEFFETEPRGINYVDTTGMSKMPAEEVAKIIYDGVKRNKRAITITFFAKFSHFMNCIAPRLVDWIVSNMYAKLKKSGHQDK